MISCSGGLCNEDASSCVSSAAEAVDEKVGEVVDGVVRDVIDAASAAPIQVVITAKRTGKNKGGSSNPNRLSGGNPRYFQLRRQYPSSM